jgi:hypothetical protein
MKRFPLAFVLGLTTLITFACDGCDGGTTTGGGGQLEPYRDDWRVEAEVPFPYLNDAGEVLISSVRIGGRTYQDNFANRGDVIVEFEEGRSTIKIEMRRFTMALSRANAEEDFEALQLWAYSANQASPRKPGDMDPEATCIPTPDKPSNVSWREDCAIRVYYDGQSQIARAGADFRVTMPASYRHNVRIVTQDADGDNDYINRGTVCVNNLNGSAEIDLENGVASVILAENSLPIPTCTPEQVTACDEYVHQAGTDDEQDAPWHPDCPCIVETNSSWGSVRVESAEAAAADMTIDAPEHLWMNITARNESSNQSQSDHCPAVVTMPTFVEDERPFAWSVRGTTSKPSSFASGGYGTTAISKDCSPIAFTTAPQEFVGSGNGHEQMSEQRGNVTICTNCIRGQRCEDLIDG